jgi:Pentapeptide repeats (8 copies)
VDVAGRPEGWIGLPEQFDKLKSVDLRDSNFVFADMSRAFLAKADLRGSNLAGAQLQHAVLTGAWLQSADLKDARLQGANLMHAELQRANLVGAQLQGAELAGAQLQGADLREAALWRADLGSGPAVDDAAWDIADLRGMNVGGVEKVDALIAEVTATIPERGSRHGAAGRLTWALRDRPARPDFPEEWRSTPNVLFEPGDPAPEPFEWGSPKWTTEPAYDEDLAAYLGGLASVARLDLGGEDIPRRRRWDSPGVLSMILSASMPSVSPSA